MSRTLMPSCIPISSVNLGPVNVETKQQVHNVQSFGMFDIQKVSDLSGNACWSFIMHKPHVPLCGIITVIIRNNENATLLKNNVYIS